MSDKTIQVYDNKSRTTIDLLVKDNGDGTFSLAVAEREIARLAASSDLHTPAADTDAVLSYPAGGAGVSHVLSGLAWSYNADPTGGTLNVYDGDGSSGAQLRFAINITNQGPGFIEFNPPKKFTANTALTIKLLAAGDGVAGIVNAIDHWTE